MAVLEESWPGGRTATMDVDLDQANAAGGAIVVEITPGAGNEFFVLYGTAANSGTNTVFWDIVTAAGGTTIVQLAAIGSGAATRGTIPQTSSSSGSSSATEDSSHPWQRLVSGTQVLRIRQTGAGAVGDNFRVLVNIRIKGAVPTVSKANSTNEADVTVAAGALSFTVI